jgi:glycosyltransferase involved in cell wall biosynthesis
MSDTANSLPLITVMLPVRNEERFIRQTLQQIHDQAYPKDRLDVIVADGMSTDRTREIVKEFAAAHPDLSVRLIENPKRLSSAARNLALSNGRGDYFLLIDGHVHIPGRDTIASYARLAVANDAQCLGRPQPLTPPDIDQFQQLVALARQSPLAHSQESFIYSQYEGWTSPISIGVMYRRDLVERMEPFDESFDAAEDLEFNYRVERLGVQCYTSPSLTVQYYPRESFRGLFRQTSRYGYGRAAFVFKHPERFTIETVVPAGFVATMAGLPLLALLFDARLVWAWLALAAIYISVLTLEGVRLARRTGRPFDWRLPAIIACVHAGMGTGFLQGMLRWPRRWRERRRS